MVLRKKNILFCLLLFTFFLCYIKAVVSNKTNWLNNIIVFKEPTFIYVHFGLFSTGDIVIHRTSFPYSFQRPFYGLKQNGRPFFGNEENYVFDIDYYGWQYEGESIVIKLNTDDPEKKGKEYLLTVAKQEGKAELYDLENKKIYVKGAIEFSSKNAESLRPCFLPLANSNSEYNYIVGIISNENKVYFQKHTFTSLEDFESTQTYNEGMIEVSDSYGNGVSCFQTSNKLIICFYLTKNSDKINYTYHKFDENLSDEDSDTIESSLTINIFNNINYFCKCIHLEGEVGIFSSYNNYEGTIFPFLQVREYSNNRFNNYLPTSDSSIIIEKYNDLSPELIFNDIIKVKDNTIVFSSIASDKKTLYIILINFFGNKKYKLRYYSIPIHSLFNFRILVQLKLNTYNNLIAFASSYCPQDDCDANSNAHHYSAFFIFSYPNSTDTTLNLDKIIFSNNTNVDNFEIDLKNQLKLDNNIFGYVLSNITVEEIEQSSDYKLYSSKNELTEIVNNYTLDKDENIILKNVNIKNDIKPLNIIIL